MKVAETYVQMKERHQKEVNEFPMMWAFNNDQFAQGMKKLGLQETDTDKMANDPRITRVGGFIRKTDADKLDEMFTRHTKERKEAMAADIDGTGYLFQMFRYELANHEYSYTGDAEETLDALGLTYGDVNSSPAMRVALNAAIKVVCNDD